MKTQQDKIFHHTSNAIASNSLMLTPISDNKCDIHGKV